MKIKIFDVGCLSRFETTKICIFFDDPNPDLLRFLPAPCLNALKNVATHLYCATKDIQAIKDEAGGKDIHSHFTEFRAEAINGNICKACGMNGLASFRAGVENGDQWRADYDHQLCKSKYPIFAVHPDNLIPLCEICNQDAKKAKDLFRGSNENDRLAFYPYSEQASNLVDIVIDRLRDPEPTIKVIWTTNEGGLIDKLDTWDEVYEIRSRVEGRHRSSTEVILDEINPNDLAHLETQILDRARVVPEATLKRKGWAFWYQRLFIQLSEIDIAHFAAKWEFVDQQGAEGGEHILAPP